MIDLRRVTDGRARRFALTVVPSIAAVATVALLSTQAATYRASASTTIPADSVGASALYMANLQVKSRSNDVIAPVAEKVGIATSDLKESLTLQRIQQSSTVRLAATAPSGADAEAAAEGVLRAASAALATDDLRESQRSAESATRQFDGAQQSVDDFLASRGFVDPALGFDQQQKTVEDTRQRLNAAQAAGNLTSANTLKQLLDSQSAQLQDQRGAIAELGTRRALLDAAQSLRNETQRTLVESQAAVDRTQADTFATASPAVIESQRATWLQSAILAAAVSGVVFIALFAAIDTRRARRAGRSRSTPAVRGAVPA